MAPNFYLPVQVKVLLLLPQILVLSLPLPLPPPLLLQLLLLLLLIITRDTFAAAKSILNGTLKVFDKKVKSCFSKFIIIMAYVFLIREAEFILKELGS